MITVKCRDGSIRILYLAPPLRLPPAEEAAASANPRGLPADIVRRILSFLTTEDQLAADSTCRVWRQAAQPLWQGRRAEVALALAYEKRLHRQWQRLYGFLSNARVSLHGPARDMDIEGLKGVVSPWKLPGGFAASLKLHDGQKAPPLGRVSAGGLYLGAKLLTTREIIEIALEWRQLCPLATSNHNSGVAGVLTIPLFSAVGARQVALELRHNHEGNSAPQKTPNGRIVLVSPVAPFAPHFRVLATSWEDFLTLV